MYNDENRLEYPPNSGSLRNSTFDEQEYTDVGLHIIDEFLYYNDLLYVP